VGHLSFRRLDEKVENRNERSGEQREEAKDNRDPDQSRYEVHHALAHFGNILLPRLTANPFFVRDMQ
jgi:hypothetical protein